MSEIKASRIRPADPRDLHDIKDRLYRASRAYVGFFQSLFGSRQVGNHRWSSDPENSEIHIFAESPQNQTAPFVRPIISLARGAASWGSTSLGGMQPANYTGTSTTFTDLIQTNITISCVSKEQVEAQHLAYIVFTSLRLFKPIVQKFGKIHHIANNMMMGPVTQPGNLIPGSSVSEWRMVQVTSPIAIQETIKIWDTEDSDFRVMLDQLTMRMKLMGFGDSVIEQEVRSS